MSSLEQTLISEAQKIPKIFLARLIQSKLDEMGFPQREGLVEALIAYVESDTKGEFSWYGEDGIDQVDENFRLEFSDDDVSKLESDISIFLNEKLPDIIRNASDDASREVLKELHEKWTEVNEYEKGAYSKFQHRLEKRWGEAFASLRMLLSIARDAGEEHGRKNLYNRSHRRGSLDVTLHKLHARACQIGGEISTLIQSGYADGAMARWRTLHELVVVANVLVEGGEDLAQRYLDHEIVETKGELDEFQKYHGELGQKPVDYWERQQIKKEYEKAINKYGESFRHQYGWAAKCLKKKKPTFKDLEEFVSHSHIRPYYRYANQNVHASPKRLFSSLSAIGDEHLTLAGASNTGFEDPAINTAYSIVEMVGLLHHDRWEKLDVLIEMMALLHLRKEIASKFSKASERLEKDHSAVLENF